ncbi:MAG TPA: aspartate ammonia-lyase [Clostridia bacterium]
MNGETANYRLESDMLGDLKIPNNAYYGIHTARAIENFPVSGKAVNRHLINAMVIVKKAALKAHKNLEHIPSNLLDASVRACDEILSGSLLDNFVVDSLQGGAGTSTNMNVNEVIANRAIELLGGSKGDYSVVHPLHHINCCQSTNDVYPTALRIAAIGLLRLLSQSLASLQESLQKKEREFSDVLMLGRTQLMDALPMMAGQGFGAYARAVSRDRWRLYKAEERLREVNIGGTAIGTGMNAEKAYIFRVIEILRELTGFGLARSEFSMDNTQNMDVFVEVSGLLKAAAATLSKISSDLRLLASGPLGGISELILPAVQAGSSIMPGKVNPVIPEMVNQAAIKVMANDAAITISAMSGQLQLNAFSPLIAESLLESIEIMTRAVVIFEKKCIEKIQINEERCRENVCRSSSLATALVHHIGYEKASHAALKAVSEGKTIYEVMKEDGSLPDETLDKILNPYEITRPGIPGK